MARIEIPLLRESKSFACRLVIAAQQFGQPRFFYHRRINWSYRYDETFYDREAACYLNDPDGYLAGQFSQESALTDVYPKKLNAKATLVVFFKVFSHWLFYALGKISDANIRRRKTKIYRKCYVDDIELVFEPAESKVVRAVFPFPISVRRQLRYIIYLHREGLRFKLDGNPYIFSDLLRFAVRRDIQSLARLETRAQIRLGQAVLRLGIATVQLSDEFDIGSLDFTRFLARHPVRVINSAHGVGKYYPAHCYQEFFVLTNRQKDYYYATRSCNYLLRRLNDKSLEEADNKDRACSPSNGQLYVAFLSQKFDDSKGIISDNELVVLEALHSAFANLSCVKLLYKPHPNRRKFNDIPGFTLLGDLQEANDHRGTIFVSFFSTCQIDPAFKGKKILIKGKYIHPEIAFDESETILDVSELIQLVKGCTSCAANGIGSVVRGD